MDFVTVACDRDYDLMLLQAESMNKFVDQCTHWIFVNERFPNKTKWNSLRYLYTRHNLKLIYPKWNEYLFCFDGFVRHAVYKLLMVEYTDNDFVALDPKNFFIKSCNINEWNGIVGSGRIGWDAKWARASKRYADYFNEPMVTDTMLLSECPFVYRNDRLKRLGDMRKFVKWYLGGQACETVLYSYLTRDIVEHTEFSQTYTNRTFWRDDPNITQEVLDQLAGDPNIKVMGFHRFYRYKSTPEELMMINNWIKSFGLNYQIPYYTPDWWDKFINKKIYKQLNSGKVRRKLVPRC